MGPIDESVNSLLFSTASTAVLPYGTRELFTTFDTRD